MKKTLALLMMIAMIPTLGTAFAADKAAPDRTAGLSNGITTFDLGPASSCDEAAVAPTIASAMPYNGITVFEPERNGSASNGSCAGRVSSKLLAGRTMYNGVTLF